jgi:hypothetical protein
MCWESISTNSARSTQSTIVEEKEFMKKVKLQAIDTQPSNEKKRISLKRRVSILLGLSAISVAAVCVSLNQKVEATQYVRPNPWTVILPDWAGQWNCNLDGRSAVLQLYLANTSVCNGNICQITIGTRIAGRISDNGGAWRLIEQRSFNSGDIASSRRDHMLPLRYNNTDNWMLIMHTGDRNYASGYTTWNGIPFGLQCRKS